MLDLSLPDPVTINLTYTELLGVLRRDEDKKEGSDSAPHDGFNDPFLSKACCLPGVNTA